jgi:hypothetical protein
LELGAWFLRDWTNLLWFSDKQKIAQSDENLDPMFSVLSSSSSFATLTTHLVGYGMTTLPVGPSLLVGEC